MKPRFCEVKGAALQPLVARHGAYYHGTGVEERQTLKHSSFPGFEDLGLWDSPVWRLQGPAWLSTQAKQALHFYPVMRPTLGCTVATEQALPHCPSALMEEPSLCRLSL